LIHQAEVGPLRLGISAVNWGEVYCSIAHRQGDDQATLFCARLRRLPFEIVPADRLRAEHAGKFCNYYRSRYADAFAASLAGSQDATLVIGDHDLKSVAKAISVEFLPSATQP